MSEAFLRNNSFTSRNIFSRSFTSLDGINGDENFLIREVFSLESIKRFSAFVLQPVIMTKTVISKKILEKRLNFEFFIKIWGQINLNGLCF
jgi:hypothetical protein